ncbi:hypothetical protein MHU86_19218 [Fragilaria crotonensis]|nr:hypothetical protein MHU86_19218 [Fragilaria crotonensis]
MFETTRQLWQRSRLTLGTTPLDSKTMYKPGGTLLLTLANATGRIIKQHSDKWGRWVSQVFQGGLNRQIVIVSAYQPVTDKVQAGQITVAAQHYNLLTSSQDKLTSPRAAFCRDLLLYLKECASHGYQIVLVGDFNEVLGSEPDGLVKIMNALSLIDLMSGKHSQTRPATYARGIKCLDHILVSQDLLPAASACGYEPFNHRHPSDHRAYYVDFHIDQLFGAQIPQLSKYEPRMLQSTNIRQVTEYIQFKYDSLSRANLFHRAEKLQKAGDRHQFAERLDKDLLAISLAAENHITKFAAPHWSLELHNARYRVQLLKKYLSSLRTRLPVSPQLLRDLTEILQPDQIPCDIPRCQQYLRQAKLNVNKIVAQSYERRDTERKHKLQILNSSTSPKDRATATTLKALQKIETIRQVWSKLNRFGVPRIAQESLE